MQPHNSAETSAVLGDTTIPDVNASLYDASGNAIESHLDADGGYHLGVAISQSVLAVDDNSSATNLAAGNGYTFTGEPISTLGVSAIQVGLFADKSCQVYIQQSTNDTPNWDISDHYYYAANSNFGVTVQATTSYFRVVVTTNNETTTVFRLQSVLCPIAMPLPRSLDANRNLKIACPVDIYGSQSENTLIGEMRVAEPARLVGSTFNGTTIDTRFWVAAAAGTGATIAQASAQMLLTSGTADAAAVTLYSFRNARYVSGVSMRYRAVIQLSAKLANNKRRWGVGTGASLPTITDGAWFQWNGTEFGIVTCKGTSETKVTSFNGNLGATYDPGITVKTYEIYWTNSKILFVVGDEILHTVTASSATWSNTMSFHVFADSLNSATVTSSTMAIRVASIARLGKLTTAPNSYYHATGTTAGVNLKLGAGNIHGLIISNVTNNAVITLSDSISTTTPTIFKLTSAAQSQPTSMDMKGLPFYTGLRLTVSGANASVVVIYE